MSYLAVRNVALNRYASQFSGVEGPRFFETSYALDGNLQTSFALTQYNYLTVQLDMNRVVSRIVILSDPTKISTFGFLGIQGFLFYSYLIFSSLMWDRNVDLELN